jgi:hypothetical protein
MGPPPPRSPEPLVRRSRTRCRRAHPVFCILCAAVVFFHADEPRVSSSLMPSLRLGATKVRTVLPHSFVDAPAFEPRGNVVSTTAPPRTLLVMPAFEPGWEIFLQVTPPSSSPRAQPRSLSSLVSFRALAVQDAVSLSPSRSPPWPWPQHAHARALVLARVPMHPRMRARGVGGKIGPLVPLAPLHRAHRPARRAAAAFAARIAMAHVRAG